MSKIQSIAAATLVMTALSACGVKKADDATAAAASTASIDAAAESAASATSNPTVELATAQAPINAIQTQPGPTGSTALLERVSVTGNVLTVQLRLTGGERTTSLLDVRDVSVIDDATSNKISVLKDANGAWMAAPLLSPTSSDLNVRPGGPPVVVWFKFPAPSPTSTTVSINIPTIAPFDGVPITR